jgi:hypothetical protein
VRARYWRALDEAGSKADGERRLRRGPRLLGLGALGRASCADRSERLVTAVSGGHGIGSSGGNDHNRSVRLPQQLARHAAQGRSDRPEAA